jgi:hypothetical protein
MSAFLDRAQVGEGWPSGSEGLSGIIAWNGRPTILAYSGIDSHVRHFSRRGYVLWDRPRFSVPSRDFPTRTPHFKR